MMVMREVVVRNICWYPEHCEERSSETSAEDDSDDGDEGGGGEEHLPGVSHRVLHCQGEGHGTSETREPEHVLIVDWNLVLASQVQNKGERIDVDCSSNCDGKESDEDEGEDELVMTEGEHGDSDIREDEVLQEEVEHLEQLLSPDLGLQGEVVGGVVSLKYSTEQNRHDPRHLRHLGDQITAVTHQEEQGGLQHLVVLDPGELGQDGGHDTNQRAQADRTKEDEKEVSDSFEECSSLECVRIVEGESRVVMNSSTQHYGHSIIEQRLTQHQTVHQRIHVEVSEDGEGGDWISGGHDGAKVERVKEGDLDCDELTTEPGEAGDDHCGDHGAEQSKGEDAAEVVEELFLPHAVASVEDDWRQDQIEEYLRVKCCLLLNIIVTMCISCVHSQQTISESLVAQVESH